MATQTATTFTNATYDFASGIAALQSAAASGKFKATGVGTTPEALLKFCPENEKLRLQLLFKGKIYERKSEDGSSFYALCVYSYTDAAGTTHKGSVRATLGMYAQGDEIMPSDAAIIERMVQALTAAQTAPINALMVNRGKMGDSERPWAPVVLVFQPQQQQPTF